ncbi:hypothetical protein V8C44DRAFT_328100 [Trichoderma aethiopicum]
MTGTQDAFARQLASSRKAPTTADCSSNPYPEADGLRARVGASRLGAHVTLFSPPSRDRGSFNVCSFVRVGVHDRCVVRIPIRPCLAIAPQLKTDSEAAVMVHGDVRYTRLVPSERNRAKAIQRT